MLLASGRQKTGEDTCFDYVDMDYRRLDLRRGHPNSGSLPARPECFDEMVRLAGILSRGIPHVRVDFYQADGRVYFGEMTFYPAGGTQAFEPPEWDSIWGGWIDLEPVRRKYGAGTEKGS